MFRKIVSSTRFACKANGQSRTFRLPPTSGGSNARVAQYAIAVLEKSANVQLGLDLYHGPTPELMVSHSTVITTAAPSAAPCAVIGTADTTEVLCEFLQCRLIVVDPGTAGEEWATIEVYEVLKAF